MAAAVRSCHVGDRSVGAAREPTTRLHRADAWHIDAQTAQGIDDGLLTTWRRWRRKMTHSRAGVGAEIRTDPAL